MNKRQHRTMFALASKLGIGLEELHAISGELCHKDHLTDLNNNEAAGIIRHLMRRVTVNTEYSAGDPVSLVLGKI